MNESIFKELIVIKRSGQRVSFNGGKIAIAIKKAFDSVSDNSNLKEVNKIYIKVLNKIMFDYKDRKTIKIEDIQDLIENVLQESKFLDVYSSFKNYRERRSASRDVFSVKQQHKFVKAIENLGLKNYSDDIVKKENFNINENGPMENMLYFGATVSKEFAKAYLLENKFTKAHDDGLIYIHDLAFLPMGTTNCIHLDLEKIFKDGFSTDYGFVKTPNDINSYVMFATIIIQSNQNDQHGEQNIPAFDFYMSPGVLKTFKKEFKQILYDYLDLSGFLEFVNFKKLEEVIDKVESMELDLNLFSFIYKNNKVLENIFSKAYARSVENTDKKTYQAMESFIINLNSIHSRSGARLPLSSINFGTDVSAEGRMVVKNFLLSFYNGLGNGKVPIYPVSIFKIKEGINYNGEDKNYDLFELSCKVSAKRFLPNFSFLDASYNKKNLKSEDYRTEVGYMGSTARIIENVIDSSKSIASGRGNLSFTTINLVRLGIDNGIYKNCKLDMKKFYEELGDLMDLVKNQLLQRFEIQCSKSVNNFKFLFGEGVWIDSKNLKQGDRLRKVLKHGTLSIGFIGLAECLKALTGKHHGESAESQKYGIEIIKFMRKKCDEFSSEMNLNFTLFATPSGYLSGRFAGIDKSIYGVIKGVTDRECYTDSFHIPLNYKITTIKKIKIESPYHELTNGGHVSYIELDENLTKNKKDFMNVLKIMKENNIGYCAINNNDFSDYKDLKILDN